MVSQFRIKTEETLDKEITYKEKLNKQSYIQDAIVISLTNLTKIITYFYISMLNSLTMDNCNTEFEKY